MHTLRHPRSYRLAALASLLPLAVIGCVRDTGTATSTTANTPAASNNAPSTAKKGPSDRLKIAVVPKGMTHVFWRTVKAGADAAGKELNADIIWQGPKDETDVNDQKDILNRVAADNADGICVAATDKEALVQTVTDLQNKGVPVVTIDSGIEPDVSHSFIATDNVAAAKLAAEEMGKLLGGKGKVAIISFRKGAGTSDQREQGFLEGIKAFPGITMVEPIQYSDSDAAKAQDKMNTALSANPDLAGVFASNEPNVNGVAKALKDKSLVGKVKLIGFDASPPEIDYLQTGVVQALVVQDPFKMGYEGVKAIAQIVRGQGNPEKRIDTGAKVVTKENMSQPDIHKLLYPLGPG